MIKSSIVINWSVKIAARIFLLAFVVTLALSLTGPGSEFLGGILKPLATIFFMLFVILLIFGKEIARYDAEQRPKPVQQQKPDSSELSQDGAGPNKESRPRRALTRTHLL